MLDEDQYSLPLTTFYSEKTKYRVKFQDKQIVWDNAKPPYEQNVLPIENVIAVQYSSVKTSSTSEIQSNDPKQFTIHYAKRKTNNKWKHKCWSLNHSEAFQVTLWVTTLQNKLESFSHRPKHLLLFVNPFGGKQMALQSYEKYGKPLFNIAGVDVSVIVSQRPNQIRDLLIRHNLDIFDSVGCVGGDGTVSELINGLVLRECQLRDIDLDDMTQELPKPTIPVGIIPGGSTDTTAYCVYGTTDITTAVLHIILGDSLGLDLVSVHNDNRLLTLYADVASYGYLGDIAHFSEELRWMGPARYEYTGFKKIMANKGYEGEITVLSDSTNISDIKCYENCEECFSRRSQQSEDNNEEGNWKTIEGKFFMVSGANISCAGERNPHGLAPYSHLGDGYLHLVIIHHTSLVHNLRTLQRFMSSSYSIDDLSHVEVHRTKEFRFRAGHTSSRWNCDGEVIHQTDIRARVHCQLLTVFSRGISKPTKRTKICFGC